MRCSIHRLLTSLHIAADKSHYDVMEVLLKHNAKLNALDRLGQTALHRYVPPSRTIANPLAARPPLRKLLILLFTCEYHHQSAEYGMLDG